MTAPPPTTRWIAVARVGDVPPGEARPIDLAGTPAVLYRDGDVHYAAQRRCPHAGFDLSEGFVSRGHLVCPLHMWRFDAATGAFVDPSHLADTFTEIIGMPCLITYAVRVVDDSIEVDPTPRPRVPPANRGDSP